MLPSCRQRHETKRNEMLWSLKTSTREKTQAHAWRVPPIIPPWAKITKSSRPLLARGPQKTHLKWFGPIISHWQWSCQALCNRSFPLQFPWEISLSSMTTTGTRRHQPGVQEWLLRTQTKVFRYGQPSANSGSSPGGKRTTPNRFCQGVGGGGSYYIQHFKRCSFLMIVESQLTVFHNSQIFLTETQNHHFLLGHDIYSIDPISCISEQQQR